MYWLKEGNDSRKFHVGVSTFTHELDKIQLEAEVVIREDSWGLKFADCHDMLTSSEL